MNNENNASSISSMEKTITKEQFDVYEMFRRNGGIALYSPEDISELAREVHNVLLSRQEVMHLMHYHQYYREKYGTPLKKSKPKRAKKARPEA